eukprot:14199541-Alexandrium_andersonii.AAC.1
MAASSDHPLGITAAAGWWAWSIGGRRGARGRGVTRVVGDLGDVGDAPLGGGPASEWEPLTWA